MQTPSLQQLLEAGVHFGHRVSRGNPRMKPYVYGARDGVNIIDLTLSEKGLKEATKFVEELGKSGGVLLLVGTKKQAQALVKEWAETLSTPYLVNRWIGGFLTNFEEVSKNIKRLKELREQKGAGGLKKYTKKEQLLLDRRMAQLERDLGGVVDMDKLPDAIFLVDAAKEQGAVKEASRMGVKVVAIADTNCDPSLIDYIIPGNDDAVKSVKLLVDTIAGSYGEGLKEAKNIKEKADSDDEKAKDKEAKKEAMKTDGVDAAVVEDVAVAEEEIEKKELEDAKRVE